MDGHPPEPTGGQERPDTAHSSPIRITRPDPECHYAVESAGAQDPSPQPPAPGRPHQPTPTGDRPPAPGPWTIAVVSTKGGVGKTTVIVALAAAWATAHPDHNVIVLDLDRQDRGSATSWLDSSADTIANLTWAETTSDGARQLVHNYAGRDAAIFLDLPPSTENMDAVMAAARRANLILIPGTIDEDDITAQTARALDIKAPGVPYAAVFTQTASVTLESGDAADIIEALDMVDVPVAGSIRSTRALAIARRDGRLPAEIIGRMADPVAADIAALTRWVAHQIGAPPCPELT